MSTTEPPAAEEPAAAEEASEPESQFDPTTGEQITHSHDRATDAESAEGGTVHHESHGETEVTTSEAEADE